jgi:hypothetical protein
VRQCSIGDCATKYFALGYCEKHYQRFKKTGDPLKVKFQRASNVHEAFRLRTEPAGDCLIWTGGRDRGGAYGSMRHQGGTKKAHRVAWELANGEIPPGMDIDHKCHVPLCVNPEHLRATTRKQNKENVTGARRDSSTGILGAHWHRSSGKFTAEVKHNGHRFHLGTYSTAEEAGAAAKAKRLELFTHNDADRITS